MNDIRALLKMAATRLELVSFVRALHVTAIVLAALALLIAIVDRVPGEAIVAWRWVAPALALATLAAAGIIWSRRRLSEVQVAISVDERLDLRERLSTALHCHDRDDPFAQAAVEDAVVTARDARSRERVRRHFAFRAPTRWWIAPTLILVTAGVLQLPQANLFAAEEVADQDALTAARTEVQETLDVIAKVVQERPELSAELGDLADELSVQSKSTDSLEKPEEVKREALKKVTELNRRLDEIVSGQKGKTVEALEDMLAKLETPPNGAASELAEALAEGDFAAAKKALEKMLEQAEAGAMSEEQKKALADALDDLGEQLEKLAADQKKLEQALEQAGLNPQLANNPQALQQALDQAANLNDQQRQQLQEMIQAQQMAQQMCQGLGGACQRMAQGMQGGQLGEAGQQMGQQLNDMEQLQQLLQQAQAAAGQCKGGGLGQGMNMNQAMQQWMQGPGMGNWGQGAGGKAPIAPTPSATRLTKTDVPIGDGEIIASMLIDGQPIRGESRAKLRNVVSAGAAGYDEALNEDPLPRQYHEAQKHYFGELKRQVEAVMVPADEKPAGTDGGDAGSADDADTSD
jgi:hypothetical protein